MNDSEAAVRNEGASRPILITTSFVLHAPLDEATEEDWLSFGFDDLITQTIERLRQAAESGVKDMPMVVPAGNYHCAFLGEEDTNSRRCDVCGLWLTDPSRPDSLDGLMPGYEVEGVFLCNQHYELKIDSGGILRPNDYWSSDDEEDPAS